MSFLNTRQVALDYQKGGPGQGQRRILDVIEDVAYGMGEWTESLGAITRDFRKDPRTNKMRAMPVRRGNPEPVTFAITCRMKAFNVLESFGADDRLVLYKRYTGTLPPSDLLKYIRIEQFVDCAIVDRQEGAGATDGSEEESWITLTTNFNAAAANVILPVKGKTLAHGITAGSDVALNCLTMDEDGVIWIGTDEETAGAPYIFKGVPDADGVYTWTGIEITGQTAAIETIAAAGDYLLFGIGTNILRAAKSAPATVTTTAFGGAVNHIVAIDAANIVAVGASGLLRKSEDGGLSWTTVATGSSAALNRIAVRSLTDWWIGGATGTILHYDSGAVTTISDPTSGAGINAVALPADRDSDVYLGTSTGAVWKSQNDGTTWAQYRFPGDSAGSVDELGFGGEYGGVLYIVHTPASGSTRVLRDLAGGIGGNSNVEALTVPANTGFNGLLVSGVNEAFLVSALHSGANMIVQVEV